MKNEYPDLPVLLPFVRGITEAQLERVIERLVDQADKVLIRTGDQKKYDEWYTKMNDWSKTVTYSSLV